MTDTALRTDTPEQQAIHYPETTRRASNPMPDRAEWTIRHRTPYSSDIDEARNDASTLAVHHASEQEIEAATRELDTLWKTTARQVRDANKQARAVYPFYDAKRDVPWREVSDAYDALSDQHKQTVEDARDLVDARKHLHALAKSLRGGYLDRFAAHRAAGLLDPQSCPVYSRISARYNAARDQAAEDYEARIRSRPIDDEAWAEELRRRESNEAFFRDGPIVRRTVA